MTYSFMHDLNLSVSEKRYDAPRQGLIVAVPAPSQSVKAPKADMQRAQPHSNNGQ
jgi:hypothetical protein